MLLTKKLLIHLWIILLKTWFEENVICDQKVLLLFKILNFFYSAGTLFLKQKKTPGSSKHFYVKLSPNKKTLYYDDWKDEKTIPQLDELKQKIIINEFLTGNECINHSNQYGLSLLQDTNIVIFYLKV